MYSHADNLINTFLYGNTVELKPGTVRIYCALFYEYVMGRQFLKSQCEFLGISAQDSCNQSHFRSGSTNSASTLASTDTSSEDDDHSTVSSASLESPFPEHRHFMSLNCSVKTILSSEVMDNWPKTSISLMSAAASLSSL